MTSLRPILVFSAISLIFNPAHADELGELSPRVEAGLKAGTERSIFQTEVWVPIHQERDRVLYGDLRFSGDDGNNVEQNLGVGYRQIDGNKIYGGHVWADRRHTENGSTFYQATIGAEAFTKVLDARANIYYPITGTKTYTTANTGSVSPYLAGTGLFVDTPGRAVEEAQKGFDIEIGTTLPLFEKTIDSARVYGGFYHFQGDKSENVTGWRARATTDVTPWVSLGARYQHDDVRGGQAFAEATFRFPGKASYRKEGMRARLDESPERDIDIVTGSVVQDTGQRVPVLNTATGQQQRVIHVDNTAAVGGDGSAERPYNTLAAAQAALKDYDTVYIHTGNGTSTGQNAGISIAQKGVQLIGAGTNFVYDSGRFTSANGRGPQSTLIKAAGAAPLITNPGGDGITVTGDKASIAGVSVNGTTGRGVHVMADGTHLTSTSISSITASNNANAGISVEAMNGGRIDNVEIINNTMESNTNRGVFVQASATGDLGHVRIENNIARNNVGGGGRGINVVSTGGGSVIDDVSINNNIANNNGLFGINVEAVGAGGQITSTAVTNNTVFSINVDGIRFDATGAGSSMNNLVVTNNNSYNNTGFGYLVNASTNGLFNTVDLTKNQSSGNNNRGFYVIAQGGGDMNTVRFVENSSMNNTGVNGRGFDFSVTGGGSTMGTVTVTNINSSGNSNAGLYFSAANASQVNTLNITNLTTNNNGATGTFIEAASATGQISNININGLTANNNTSGTTAHGFALLSTTGGTVTNAVLNNIHTANNTSAGIELWAGNGAGNGSITASLANSSAVNNGWYGVYFLGQNTSALTASMSTTTSTGNANQGVHIDDDTTGAWVVDLGGGALGSIGRNRIFGGGAVQDIRVDMDGGNLFARNNWWGQAGGPLGGDIVLDAGSTLDSSGALATDPGQ